MNLDDMILVSIDDHMIEPPDMYKNHVPARWQDEAPKVVRNERGVDEWVFQGNKTSTPFGMAATPTMAGFNARTFHEAHDKEVALVMLQAYNDWAIDEWCGAYPGRFIPLGIVPMWDVDLAVAEVPARQEGLPVHQLPGDPARAGLPELPVRPLGPDDQGAVRGEHGALAAHRRRVRGDQAAS